MPDKNFEESVSDEIIRDKLEELSDKEYADKPTLLRSDNEDRYVKNKDKFQTYVIGFKHSNHVYATRVADKLYFYKGQGTLESTYQLSTDTQEAVNHEVSIPETGIKLDVEDQN